MKILHVPVKAWINPPDIPRAPEQVYPSPIGSRYTINQQWHFSAQDVTASARTQYPAAPEASDEPPLNIWGECVPR